MVRSNVLLVGFVVALAAGGLHQYIPDSLYKNLPIECSTNTAKKSTLMTIAKSETGNSIVEEPAQVRQPDAYIEGLPLYLVNDSPPTSHVHCLSENFHENSWLFRSCRFENLCFDMGTKTFVLHPSEHQINLEKQLHNQTFISSKAEDVIAGGQHPSWLQKGRSKWKPETRVVRPNATTSYYALPEDTVWISFFPWGGCNPGHLLWDSFLPVYTLLDIFDLTDKKLFLTEMYSRRGDCPELMNEFAPMMGMKERKPQFITHLNLTNATESNLVCTHHSASGMGWLTDNGLNLHGSQKKDFDNPHNVFRASNLAGFRHYLLHNIGMGDAANEIVRPYRVTFSILSSRDQDRRFDFARQHEAVQKAFVDHRSDGDVVLVQSIAMWNHTVREQIEIATQSAVYISVNGGGTTPAFFMPKGASLILYGKENERFDWDLFNNYAQLRTHWLTLSHMEEDTELLVNLIREQLESIESFAFAATKVKVL